MRTLVVAFRNRTSAHPALSTGLALAVILTNALAIVVAMAIY